MCFLFVLRIAPNSLLVTHSHCCFLLSLFTMGAFSSPMWLPSGNSLGLSSELGGPADAGLLSPPFCLLIVLWAGNSGQLSHGFPWFAFCRGRHDKGKAARAAWEHLICAPDFNTSVKHWLPSPGFSLCCWKGLENADLGRAGRKWAGFVI